LPNAQPAPDAYHAAPKALSVDAGDVLAVEDTATTGETATSCFGTTARRCTVPTMPPSWATGY
jgi:hypothetical protein